MTAAPKKPMFCRPGWSSERAQVELVLCRSVADCNQDQPHDAA